MGPGSPRLRSRAFGQLDTTYWPPSLNQSPSAVLSVGPGVGGIDSTGLGLADSVECSSSLISATVSEKRGLRDEGFPISISSLRAARTPVRKWMKFRHSRPAET